MQLIVKTKQRSTGTWRPWSSEENLIIFSEAEACLVFSGWTRRDGWRMKWWCLKATWWIGTVFSCSKYFSTVLWVFCESSIKSNLSCFVFFTVKLTTVWSVICRGVYKQESGDTIRIPTRVPRYYTYRDIVPEHIVFFFFFFVREWLGKKSTWIFIHKHCN